MTTIVAAETTTNRPAAQALPPAAGPAAGRAELIIYAYTEMTY
jgi:hypothetical protein